MKRWMTVAFALSAAAAAAEEPTLSSPMSLRAAVTYALAHSPELKISQAEVARRGGLATATQSLLRPQLDGAFDATTASLALDLAVGRIAVNRLPR